MRVNKQKENQIWPTLLWRVSTWDNTSLLLPKNEKPTNLTCPCFGVEWSWSARDSNPFWTCVPLKLPFCICCCCCDCCWWWPLLLLLFTVYWTCCCCCWICWWWWLFWSTTVVDATEGDGDGADDGVGWCCWACATWPCGEAFKTDSGADYGVCFGCNLMVFFLVQMWHVRWK